MYISYNLRLLILVVIISVCVFSLPSVGYVRNQQWSRWQYVDGVSRACRRVVGEDLVSEPTQQVQEAAEAVRSERRARAWRRRDGVDRQQ